MDTGLLVTERSFFNLGLCSLCMNDANENANTCDTGKHRLIQVKPENDELCLLILARHRQIQAPIGFL